MHAFNDQHLPKSVKISFPACPPDFGPTMLEMLATISPVQNISIRCNESQLEYLRAHANMFENSGLGNPKRRRAESTRINLDDFKGAHADYRRQCLWVNWTDGDGRLRKKYSKRVDFGNDEEVEQNAKSLMAFLSEADHELDTESNTYILANRMPASSATAASPASPASEADCEDGDEANGDSDEEEEGGKGSDDAE